MNKTTVVNNKLWHQTSHIDDSTCISLKLVHSVMAKFSFLVAALEQTFSWTISWKTFCFIVFTLFTLFCIKTFHSASKSQQSNIGQLQSSPKQFIMSTWNINLLPSFFRFLTSLKMFSKPFSKIIWKCREYYELTPDAKHAVRNLCNLLTLGGKFDQMLWYIINVYVRNISHTVLKTYIWINIFYFL